MDDQDGVPIATITISRRLTEDDDLMDYEMSDGLSVVEVVGMLTMTIDSILHRSGYGDDAEIG